MRLQAEARPADERPQPARRVAEVGGVNKISGCDIDLEQCRLRSGRMPWARLGRRKTDDGKNPNRFAADRADPWRAAVLMSPPRAVQPFLW